MTDHLKRQLGLWSATAVIVGEIIAVGIFLTPADMARSLASPMWLLAVWLLMAAMALSGALCYGELAARYPEAGGGYVYLREAYGPGVAFVYGWKCFLIMDPGITAALAVGMADYASYLTGASGLATKAIAVGAIVVIALANIFGVRSGARLLRVLAALKVGLLATIVIFGFASSAGRWDNFVPFASRPEGAAPFAGAFIGAMVAGFFSFAGWWDVAKLAGEVQDAGRVLPRAFAYGIGAVAAVYIATSAAFLYLVPVGSVTSKDAFAAQAGEALFGRAGGQVFSAIVVISVLGSLTALLMAAPRVYFAMANDGLFPHAVAGIHPRFGTPARAIALQATLASVLALLGTFDEILGFFLFVTVIFIGLTAASIFVVRRRDGGAAGYRTAGYPATPIFFLSLTALLVLLLGANSPGRSLAGAGLVALGIPVYRRFVRRSA